MRALVDRTGLPGPRTWSNQSFPDGKADHPVTDITWYEAAAYAAFRGKQLATIFQWEKAARNGYIPSAGVAGMPWGAFYPGDPLEDRANFGAGTLPTTSAEFGMSAFGAYNMAGNVAEWTSNDSSDGFLATGGAWGDPTYTFSLFGGRPGFFSSEKLGFRCVRIASRERRRSGRPCGSSSTRKCLSMPRHPRRCSRRWLSAYRYEKTPLDARIEQTTETPEWKRERITFNGANGAPRDRVPLPAQPRAAAAPGHALSAGRRRRYWVSDRCPTRWTTAWRRSSGAGRAAFGVVLEGYIERLRPTSFVRPPVATVEFADIMVSRVTDLAPRPRLPRDADRHRHDADGRPCVRARARSSV